MNIAFVDDDITVRNRTLPYFLQGFQQYHISIHRFDFFQSAEQFLKNYKADSYDLIILDIIMNGMTGIELGHKIREINKDVRIVLCSTSNEYANESYDIGACYYIQKPVTMESIDKMIKRFDIEDFEMRRFILLPDGQKLLLRNMIYSEYSNHAITIYMKKGRSIKIWLSQNAFLELLAPYEFFLSPNSGIILNLYEVKELEDTVFIMNDGTRQPISRRRKKDVSAQYQAFLLNMIRKEM